MSKIIHVEFAQIKNINLFFTIYIIDDSNNKKKMNNFDWYQLIINNFSHLLLIDTNKSFSLNNYKIKILKK